jgi:hypothetical protein
VAPGDGNRHVGAAAKEVAEHAGTLTRLELELAKLELRQKAVELGIGIGLGASALIFGLLGLCFALATAAAALALVVSVWVALLILTGALLVIAGIAGVTATVLLRRGSPPVPEKAIREAKLTTRAIKR